MQSKPGTMGHCSVAKVWQRKEDNAYELNIAAEVSGNGVFVTYTTKQRRKIMIGLLAAMEVELESITAKMEDVKVMFVVDKKFYHGKINGCDAVAVLSGVGKVNAAIATTLLLQNFDVTGVISVGIAGGISAQPMDVVVSDRVVQYDFDMTAFGCPLGKLDERCSPYFECDADLVRICSFIASQNGNAHVGTGASGDAFVTDPEKATMLKREFGAVFCDMESAAIAQACEKFSVPFVSVRVISDEVGVNKIEDYEAFKKAAARLSADVIEEYCKRN